MAKNAVGDWDSDADGNTDVGGVSIAEGCPPGNINNALRTIMAQVKNYSVSVDTELDDAIAELNEAIVDLGVDIDEAYRRIATRTASYTALDADVNTIQRFTSSATLSIAPWADLRANWSLEVWADGATVIIDPNLAETISGAATLVVQPGQRVTVFRSTTGTFVAYASGDTFSGAQLQGYSFGLALSRNVTDAANDIDIQSGKAAADTSPFNLMVLSSLLTKRIDAAWTVGTNAGGLDTGSVTDGTYYLFGIRRPDTGVVDALLSLSSTAPTMPTGYTQKRVVGRVSRISGSNGIPTSLLTAGPGGWVEMEEVSTTSGTSKTIAIPSSATEFELFFKGVSGSGSVPLLVRLNVGGVPVATGYEASSSGVGATVNTVSAVGFPIYSNAANIVMSGCARFKKWISTEEWIVDGEVTLNPTVGGTSANMVGRSPVLAGPMNGITLVYTDGSAFDAGSVFIRYR